MDAKGVIVCVDDEQGVLDTLSQQIERTFGKTHRVEVASSGEIALELIDYLIEDGEIIEMVITDQVMPGLKGDHLLEIVQKKIPDTIKILLTGQAGLDSAIHAINNGGLDRYIEKPWDMDKLKNDIQSLINRFRENLENQHLLRRLEEKVMQLDPGYSA